MQSTFEARIPGGEPGPLRLNARIAPGVVLNKDGAFQRTLAFRGPDLDSATLAELMGQSLRLNNALRRFGSGWCLHMEARRRPSPGYPDSDFDRALAWLIDEERRAVFEAAGARFESEYFLTLGFLPPPERQGKLEALLFKGGGQQEGVDYRAHLVRFLEESDQLLALLQTLMPAADWLGDAETLGYLHDCVSDRRLGRVGVPPLPFHLDALLTDAPLLGGLAPKLGARHLKILSVRSFVSATEPGLLDALNRLPVSYRWVTRFLPLDREDARREIEKLRKRWFSKRKGLMTLLREALFKEESALQDNDAANQAADADAALQELGADAVAAGFATLTITVAEESEAEAEAAVRLIRQVRRARLRHRGRERQCGGGLARQPAGAGLCRRAPPHSADALARAPVADQRRLGGGAPQRSLARSAAAARRHRWRDALST
jgi:type IV secretion system protein VirB4